MQAQELGIIADFERLQQPFVGTPLSVDLRRLHLRGALRSETQQKLLGEQLRHASVVPAYAVVLKESSNDLCPVLHDLAEVFRKGVRVDPPPNLAGTMHLLVVTRCAPRIFRQLPSDL